MSSLGFLVHGFCFVVFFFSLRDKGIKISKEVSWAFAGLVFMKQLFPPKDSAYNIIRGH